MGKRELYRSILESCLGLHAAALMGTAVLVSEAALFRGEFRFVPGGGSRVQLMSWKLVSGKVQAVETKPFLQEIKKTCLTLQGEDRDRLVSS